VVSDDTLRDVTVVIPTVGRPSLETLLRSLADQPALPASVVVVDDRRRPASIAVPAALRARTTTLTSGGRGPAAARNVGWSRAGTPWVVFLDDDVVVTPGWSAALVTDLAAPPDVGAVQARIRVPRPSDGSLTDAERNTVALESAPWITADLAVRAPLLEQVAGFDERFPRAYREDSDFALRAQHAGWRFSVGGRMTEHPLRQVPWWSSISAQRGNRDDALMRAVHGRRWSSTRGRRRRHVAITVAGATALFANVVGWRRAGWLATMGWAAGTGELAAHRWRGGTRTWRELAIVIATSIAIPPAAVWHWSTGRLDWPPQSTRPWPASFRSATAG
jgi:Glycosyl transferase family 2